MPACLRCGEENPEHARFCLACGSELSVEAQLHVRKTVTVLFSDVTGSTGLGERQDPELIRGVMSRYYERARIVLERHGGTVEKFIGDAVVAVFGVPVMHEDDALRALRAAVELRDAIEDLDVELRDVFGVGIAIRIGVNSGEVIAGDPTHRQSFVAGDAVNVAQRLESAADAGEILVGDPTYRLARDAIRAEPVAPLAVKGRDDLVTAHRLLEVVPGALSHARRFDSPMVGRQQELALLADAFERSVREKSCHLFTILGPAGVGKSRLVSEALLQIEEQATVLTGACLPYGEGITFWPALEVVRQATGITDDDSPEQATTKIEAALADEEASGLAAGRVAALMGVVDESGAAEEGFWGFRKLLEALARDRPLVVVFDDLNWAEPMLLDLIEHVADWSRDAPILLVAMARPDLLDARYAWGGGKRNSTTIFLEPLSADESEVLLENLLGGTLVAHEAVARIQESAEGNPLFVEESVSMLIDDGLLRRENGRWVAVGDLSRTSVPETIQILLASRLDQLDAEERRILERAALEGTVFHRGAVEELADDLGGERVAECLLSLVRKELVRPARAQFSGQDAYRFRHVLIRDAAYDALPKERRADLHERFAAWLEEVAGERVLEVEELLGYHLEQAFRYRSELVRVDEYARALASRAGGRLVSAGRRALARNDLSAAVAMLDRAIALLPAEAQRPDLLLDLGAALCQRGDFARARAILVEAEQGAERAGDLRVGTHAQLELVQLRRATGSRVGVDEFSDAVHAAISVFEQLGDEIELAWAWNVLARVEWERLHVAEVERVAEQALHHAEASGQQRELARAASHLCRAAFVGPRPVAEAVERCEAMRVRAGTDPFVEATAIDMIGGLRAMLGHFDEARRAHVQARRVYEDLGLTVVVGSGAMYAGLTELLADDPAAAERELRFGYEVLEQLGERGGFSTVAAFLSQALYAQGRFEEAGTVTETCEAAADTGDVVSQVVWRHVRGKVLARAGALQAGEQLARHAVELASDRDVLNVRGDALLDLGEVLRLAGNTEEAMSACDAALGLYEAKGNLVAARRARIAAGRPAEPLTGKA